MEVFSVGDPLNGLVYGITVVVPSEFFDGLDSCFRRLSQPVVDVAGRVVESGFVDDLFHNHIIPQSSASENNPARKIVPLAMSGRGRLW